MKDKECPLISVIVPVYKVEQYLYECVQSIIYQTYTNLEIILVDDGSPDRCPEMCDEYAKLDSRIKVIHKKNGGLSSARNVGLDIATGDYIGFVDSDDFISPTMFEMMIRAKCDCDEQVGIVSCCCYSEKKGELANYGVSYSAPELISSSDYVSKLLLMKAPHMAWGKIYINDIFTELRYREGKVNEDILFVLDSYQTIEKKQYSTLVIPDRLYYYRQRDDSICHSDNSLFYHDELLNMEEVMSRMKKKNMVIYEEYKKLYLSALIHQISKVVKEDNPFHKMYYTYCLKLWTFNDFYAKKVLHPVSLKSFMIMKYFSFLYKYKDGCLKGIKSIINKKIK